ncbi:MAG: DnaJ domain-containing protein, partial [Actinomycetota bacterium]|nr:DnaJ domain-containing protein [Actinomycetota bacterium]
MEPFIDAYAVLGVPSDAGQAELKARHRQLVRRHHPDLVPPEQRAEATRRVQDINVAYGLVRDPATRARYDRLRRVAVGRQAAAAAASGASRQVGEADARLAAQWDA